MPPKIRDLLAEPESAGFQNRSGKGSHRNFAHPNLHAPVTISGKPSDDATRYQEKQVRAAIKEVQS